MRLRRLLLIPVALVLVVPNLAPLPASAAAGCFMQTCNGRDPSDMNCDNDAQRLDQVQDGQDFLAYLDYSPACNAFWGRGVFIGSDGPVRIWAIVLETKSAVPGAPLSDYSTTTQSWTPMGESVRVARACIQEVSPVLGAYLCTAWWLPRVAYNGSMLEIPQGSPSALDTACPYGERYWAWGTGPTSSWGATWHVSGLVPWGWYRIEADVRCDGTATSVLYDVDDPAGGRHWFRVNQLAYDWAPLSSGTWQADGNGTLTVRVSNAQYPNGQVVAAGLSVAHVPSGVHCPCPS